MIEIIDNSTITTIKLWFQRRKMERAWSVITALTILTSAGDTQASPTGPAVYEDAWIPKRYEVMTKQINREEGYVSPMLWIRREKQENGTPQTIEEKARLINMADAWSCDGDPPRCKRLEANTPGVLYHEADQTYDHRGMKTRWLGGPSLTIENFWETFKQEGRLGRRNPTDQQTAEEGTSPTLKSGLHPEGRPHRLQWAFNGRPIYDHTAGMADDGDRNHQTHFWVGELFDLHLDNVTAIDDGIYTAIYRLLNNTPILETEIRLTVKYLPTPTIFGGDGRANTIAIRKGDKKTPVTCLATTGEPRATMEWYKDGIQLGPNNITDISNDRKIVQRIILGAEDQGARIACRMTSEFTHKTRTITAKVTWLQSTHAKTRKTRTAALQPAAMTIMVALIMVGALVGGTGAVLIRRRRAMRRTTTEATSRAHKNKEEQEGTETTKAKV